MKKIIALGLSLMIVFTMTTGVFANEKRIEVRPAKVEIIETNRNATSISIENENNNYELVRPFGSFHTERRCKFSVRIPVILNGVETPAYIEPNFFVTVSQDVNGKVSVKDFREELPNYFATTPEKCQVLQNNLSSSRYIRFAVAWSGNMGKREITQVTTVKNAQKIIASGQVEFKKAVPLAGKAEFKTAGELSASRDYDKTVTVTYVLESSYRDSAEVEFTIFGINEATARIIR